MLSQEYPLAWRREEEHVGGKKKRKLMKIGEGDSKRVVREC